MRCSPPEHGKHIILEKPMALTLADCDTIIAAVERHKVHLVVGHTHAFDPNVRLMRDIIARGELGKLGLINSFNYTNFLYRPRRPRGARYVEGRRHPVQSGAAPDRHRAAARRRHRQERPGASERARSIAADRRKLRGASAIRQRRRGFAGLQRLRPLRFRRMALRSQRARRAQIRSRMALRAARLPARPDETKARTETFAYGNTASALPPHQPHFGITIVTCSEGDMRASADGVTIYGRDGVRKSSIPRGTSMPGRREVLDDLATAIRTNRKPVHDGRWGKATVEVALAILRSSRQNMDVPLEHQVAVDGPPR